MKEDETSISELKKMVSEFVTERNWQTHHDPKNLSMAIAIEAAELMEHFLWVKSPDAVEQLQEHRADIEDELADIIIASLAFANASEINIVQAIIKKMKRIKEKYPINKVKNKSTAAIRKVKLAYKK